MKLIQNIDVYAPQHLGKKDVLMINDKIIKIKDPGSISADGFLSGWHHRDLSGNPILWAVPR